MIDEAFLDVTGTLHLCGGDPRRLGEALRREIRETCGVTCSVGLAPNRLLAKIGSEQNKPDGLTVMPTDPKEIAAFLAPRPIGILWGVGKKTIEALRPYGLTTCGDLQRMKPNALVSQELIDLAFGRSDEFVHWEEREEKSVSREHTFETDEPHRDVVRATLLALVGEVGYRFRRAPRCAPRWATTARLKIRSARHSRRSCGRSPSRVPRVTISRSAPPRQPSSTPNGRRGRVRTARSASSASAS